MNPPVQPTALSAHHAYSDEEIHGAILSLLERVQTLRNSLKDKSPVTYALESLPELIAEDDFYALCLTSGFVRPSHPGFIGSEFAQFVRAKAAAA